MTLPCTRKSSLILPLALLLLTAPLGCTNMSPTQQGLISGTALGALGGAGITALAGGKAGVGALIGGGLGALAGGIYGNKQPEKNKP